MEPYRWTNEIQKAIVREWIEGCEEDRGIQALRILRRQIANKYDLNMSLVKGIIESAASEGLIQRSYDYGKIWEPINYHELVGNLKEEVATLKRQFKHLLEGIDRVVEDGETMRTHVQQVRGMTRWMGKRDAIEMEEIKVTSLDANKGPPLLESEFIDPQKETERDKIKTKSMTYRTKEMEKLRAQIDRARSRVNSHDRVEKATPSLLFRGIEEGKKALPH